MAFSGQNELVVEDAHAGKSEYAVLKEHSVRCRLTKLDRRALAEYLKLTDKSAVTVHRVLSRLLSNKLANAPETKAGDTLDSIASSGSHITYAIDGLRSQKGQLVHREEYSPGEGTINIASMLGATLVGMSAGDEAPFLQADGSFRKVRLNKVD